MNQLRLEFIQAIEKIVTFVSHKQFSETVDQIYLLGSMITPEPSPNDLDLVFIGQFQRKGKSVLRCQEELREDIHQLVDCPLSINFASSIEMVQFSDGVPLEKYLLIYARLFQVDWKRWFSNVGQWRNELVEAIGAHDSEVFRYLSPYQGVSLSFSSQEKNQTHLEDAKLPREAFYRFLHKRVNAPLPQDERLLVHPPNWMKCYRSGRCCQNFMELRHRFAVELCRIYDLIQAKYAGLLWNAIHITSEADWFWLVEHGLSKSDQQKILAKSPEIEIIPCPFWDKPATIDSPSVCLIWEDRPEACQRFPEFIYEMEKYQCHRSKNNQDFSLPEK